MTRTRKKDWSEHGNGRQMVLVAVALSLADARLAVRVLGCLPRSDALATGMAAGRLALAAGSNAARERTAIATCNRLQQRGHKDVVY
jgi:hypothetical protein